MRTVMLFEDDIVAVFRFVIMFLIVAGVLLLAVFIARNVAPVIFLLADKRLAASFFGDLGLILFGGLVLAVAQLVAVFMHLRKR